MMSSPKPSKASVISHKQIQMAMGRMQSSFIRLWWSWWKGITKVRYLLYWGKRYSSGWDLFSFYLPPSLSPSLSVSSPSFFPPSSHHSKMLPGPVLVVMVTKTGGFSRDWISLGADWSDTMKWGGRDRGKGRGEWVTSHSHRFTNGRDPHSGRLQAHTDTMGVGLVWFFKVGLSWVTEVELLNSPGGFYLTD